MLQTESCDGVLDNVSYVASIKVGLRPLVEAATGSSNRIKRILVMAHPPSVKDSEITAKGSLNISAILKNRANLLERLYDDGDPATIKL